MDKNKIEQEARKYAIWCCGNGTDDAKSKDHFHYCSIKMNYIAGATMALQSQWVSVDTLPEECIEVNGYNEAWIDKDYNQSGIRVCYRNGDDWLSAVWNNVHDCYESSEESPTHYQPLPSPPTK